MDCRKSTQRLIQHTKYYAQVQKLRKIIRSISDPYQQITEAREVLRILTVRMNTTEITIQFIEEERKILELLSHFLKFALQKMREKQQTALQIMSSLSLVYPKTQKYEDSKLVMSLIFYCSLHNRLVQLYTQLIKYRYDLKSPRMMYFIQDCILYYKYNQSACLFPIQLRKIESLLLNTQKNAIKSTAFVLVQEQLKQIFHNTEQPLKESIVQYLPDSSEQYQKHIVAHLASYYKYTYKTQFLSEKMKTPAVILPFEFYELISVTPLHEHVEILKSVCMLMNKTPRLQVYKTMHAMITVIDQMYQADEKHRRQKKYKLIYDTIVSLSFEDEQIQDQSQYNCGRYLLSALLIYHLNNIFCFYHEMLIDVSQIINKLYCKLKGKAGRDLLQFCSLEVKLVRLCGINSPKERKYKGLQRLKRAMLKTNNELLLNKSRILAKISSTMEQEIKKGLRNEKKKEILTLIYRKINDIKQIIY